MRKETLAAVNEMMQGADLERERAQKELDLPEGTTSVAYATTRALLAIDGRIAALTHALLADPLRVQVVNDPLNVEAQVDASPDPDNF